ncbi:centromere protein U isoform X1 [Sagmatias obliquidens]|uniref:centromere protein U isoform X1 n=1 Tax=Sagmatias obliquidens TaxID=3371155 RepID=UPI000F440153|nr:centromere protein U isoform X1 [Lagenorhynchus obliquidens]
MAPPRQVRRSGTRYSKNTVGRTHSTKDEAGQKHKPSDVFDFPDNSGISSIGRLGENEKDEEPYETFDPPLHSTAIYADEEEFSKHCGSSLPSTPQGKEAKRSSDTSDVEASENESVKISAKKPRRKLKPISDESESTEESDIRRKVKPAENLSTQREAVSATASSEPSEKPAESVTLKKVGPLGAKPSVEKETLETESQLKTQKKKMFRGKRKKPRSEATDLDTSDCVPIWCLKEKKTSDIMELDVVLSAFENILLEYKQKTDSRICKEAINKFHSNLKEELIKMLKEVQMLKTLKRKNTKMISDIEKKRQRLIEVQDELLRLEPELKQLQIKYDELKERKASLRNAAYFLSNLKQLHQDYSDIQEEEPNVKETYDSSSLPALLFKARPLLGAENHLQNINYQLEKLLDQK